MAATLTLGPADSGAARATDIDPGFQAANPQTDAQKAMLAVVQRWRDGHNVDEKFVTEAYAEDADATLFDVMGENGRYGVFRL